MKGQDSVAFEGLQDRRLALGRQLMEVRRTLGSAHFQMEQRTLTTGEQAGNGLRLMMSSSHRGLPEDTLHGIALLSATGLIVQFNQRLAQLIGAHPEYLPGARLTDHLPDQLTQRLPAWLEDADDRPIRTSHRISTGNGQTRRLQFSFSKLPPGGEAARSLIVTDLDQELDAEAPRGERRGINAVDRSIRQARVEALKLLESALEAHSRAEAIHAELQREISGRKRAEALLREAQQRYERILTAIDSQWGSGAREAAVREAQNGEPRQDDRGQRLEGFDSTGS